MVRIYFVSGARSDSGPCGPEARLFEDKFLRRLWRKLTAQAEQEDAQ